MSGTVLLVGPLADGGMMKALGLTPAGAPVTLPGRLSGGGRAGIALDAWPGWEREAGDGIAAQPAQPTRQLARYAEIMQLPAIDAPEGRVMGAVPGPRPEDGAFRAELAAQVAADLLARDADQPAASLRARLPMIAWWAAARLRAAAERGAALPPRCSRCVSRSDSTEKYLP